MPLTLELPFATPSQNDKRVKGHWGFRKKHKDLCRSWVVFRLLEQGHKLEVRAGRGRTLIWARLKEPAKERRRVTITRHSPGQCDYGNLVGGCKGLLDVLVEVGLLVDDSPEWVEEVYFQAKAPKGKGRTVVEVAFIPPAI